MADTNNDIADTTGFLRLLDYGYALDRKNGPKPLFVTSVYSEDVATDEVRLNIICIYEDGPSIDIRYMPGYPRLYDYLWVLDGSDSRYAMYITSTKMQHTTKPNEVGLCITCKYKRADKKDADDEVVY